MRTNGSWASVYALELVRQTEQVLFAPAKERRGAPLPRVEYNGYLGLIYTIFARKAFRHDQLVRRVMPRVVDWALNQSSSAHIS